MSTAQAGWNGRGEEAISGLRRVGPAFDCLPVFPRWAPPRVCLVSQCK